MRIKCKKRIWKSFLPSFFTQPCKHILYLRRFLIRSKRAKCQNIRIDNRLSETTMSIKERRIILARQIQFFVLYLTICWSITIGHHISYFSICSIIRNFTYSKSTTLIYTTFFLGMNILTIRIMSCNKLMVFIFKFSFSTCRISHFH